MPEQRRAGLGDAAEADAARTRFSHGSSPAKLAICFERRLKPDHIAERVNRRQCRQIADAFLRQKKLGRTILSSLFLQPFIQLLDLPGELSSSREQMQPRDRRSLAHLSSFDERLEGKGPHLAFRQSDTVCQCLQAIVNLRALPYQILPSRSISKI